MPNNKRGMSKFSSKEKPYSDQQIIVSKFSLPKDRFKDVSRKRSLSTFSDDINYDPVLGIHLKPDKPNRTRRKSSKTLNIVDAITADDPTMIDPLLITTGNTGTRNFIVRSTARQALDVSLATELNYLYEIINSIHQTVTGENHILLPLSRFQKGTFIGAVIIGDASTYASQQSNTNYTHWTPFKITSQFYIDKYYSSVDDNNIPVITNLLYAYNDISQSPNSGNLVANPSHFLTGNVYTTGEFFGSQLNQSVRSTVATFSNAIEYPTQLFSSIKDTEALPKGAYISGRHSYTDSNKGISFSAGLTVDNPNKISSYDETGNFNPKANYRFRQDLSTPRILTGFVVPSKNHYIVISSNGVNVVNKSNVLQIVNTLDPDRETLTPVLNKDKWQLGNLMMPKFSEYHINNNKIDYQGQTQAIYQNIHPSYNISSYSITSLGGYNSILTTSIIDTSTGEKVIVQGGSSFLTSIGFPTVQDASSFMSNDREVSGKFVVRQHRRCSTKRTAMELMKQISYLQSLIFDEAYVD